MSICDSEISIDVTFLKSTDFVVDTLNMTKHSLFLIFMKRNRYNPLRHPIAVAVFDILEQLQKLKGKHLLSGIIFYYAIILGHLFCA